MIPDRNPSFSAGLQRVAVFVALLVLPACALMSTTRLAPPLPSPTAPLPEATEGAPQAAPPVWLNGAMLHAASVALDDLTEREAAALSRYESPHPFSVCMSHRESYDVQVVSEDERRFVVYVRPVGERCLPQGASLKGGAATYEIAKKDFKILGAIFWE